MSTLTDLSPGSTVFRADSPASPTRASLSDMLSRNKFLEGKLLHFDTPFPLLIKLIVRLYFSILNWQLLVFIISIRSRIKLIC